MSKLRGMRGWGGSSLHFLLQTFMSRQSCPNRSLWLGFMYFTSQVYNLTSKCNISLNYRLWEVNVFVLVHTYHPERRRHRSFAPPPPTIPALRPYHHYTTSFLISGVARIFPVGALGGGGLGFRRGALTIWADNPPPPKYIYIYIYIIYILIDIYQCDNFYGIS